MTREPPFGLPVLAGLPALASALDAVVTADRRLVEAVVTVSRLLDTGEVEANTGVSVEHWLGILARQTCLDRRLLLRLCRLLDRFPSLRAGVEAGRVSFAQLRGLGLVLKDAPVVIDGELDALLGRLLDELQGADPDVLIDQLRRAIVELAPQRSPAETTTVHNSLYLQPNLTGTGGRFAGEYDAVGLGVLDEATAPTRRQRHHPGGTAGARADNLLVRLMQPCDHDAGCGDADADAESATADPADGGGGGPAGGDGDPAPGGVDPAGCEGGPHPADVEDDGYRYPWPAFAKPALPVPPVKLLARVELETLGRLPVELITRLTGGKLLLATDAARRLLDTHGAELRTVIVDQGQVVGVGRSSRQPPGWMADVILAVHDTCTEPLCNRPARDADLDHATPWHPHRPDDPYGTTDIGNIGPLCTGANREKEQAGWIATQTADGRRTWTHPRTGLTITTVPATWRPPGIGPPHHSPPPWSNGPPAAGPLPAAAGPPGRSPGPPPEPDDLPFSGGLGP